MLFSLWLCMCVFDQMDLEFMFTSLYSRLVPILFRTISCHKSTHLCLTTWTAYDHVSLAKWLTTCIVHLLLPIRRSSFSYFGALSGELLVFTFRTIFSVCAHIDFSQVTYSIHFIFFLNGFPSADVRIRIKQLHDVHFISVSLFAFPFLYFARLVSWPMVTDFYQYF